MPANKTLSQQVNELIACEDWQGIVRLVEKAIAEEPEGEKSHWLLDRLSAAYYELRKYDKALELIRKAYELEPDCPLVLWDLAGTLDTMDQPAEAMKVYLKILQLATEHGMKRLAEQRCGERHEWTKALIVDCVYRTGLCLEHLGRNDDAISVYRNYLAFRAEGVPSMYKVRDVRKRLRTLEGPGKDVLSERIRRMREQLQLA